MKKLILKYKPVLQFIITFLLVYGVLTFGYKWYLQSASGQHYYPDFFTNLVGQQTKQILECFNYQVELIPHPDEPSLKFILENTYVSRLIEGCNGISVIILFCAFIIAFASNFKSTALYVLIGSILIYTINLIRITLFNLGLYYYPNHKNLLHDIIFPLVIYGTVCMLWVIWVNKLTKKKNSDA